MEAAPLEGEREKSRQGPKEGGGRRRKESRQGPKAHRKEEEEEGGGKADGGGCFGRESKAEDVPRQMTLPCRMRFPRKEAARQAEAPRRMKTDGKAQEE